MENSKHSNCKNENIEIKYLKNMRKTQFLELEKDFIELKDTELKEREVQIKNNWYYWLISYIHLPIRKIAGGLKIKL